MTARKVGQMIPRGENRWLLRWYIGKDTNGKRRYGSKIFEGTTYQAQRELSKQTVEVAEGTAVAPTKQTVQQYIEWWLANIVKNEVTPATLQSYTTRLRVDVFATVGALKLSKLTWQQIQQVYNQLREQGKSGRTIQYTHTLLTMALGHAVKTETLKKNPCDHASPGEKTRREMVVWQAPEVQLFLERTRESRDYPLWHTLLNTGLRPSEAFGLKWGDLQGDRLHIVRAVAESKEPGVYHLEEPKTQHSKRAIALTRDSIEVLQAHRKAQAAEILAAGPAFKRQDFIFATATGGFEVDTFVRRRWKRAVARVNRGLAKEGLEVRLKEMHLYGCRHSHATMLLQAGVPIKVVSERLGHSSVVITMDTYQHVLPDMQDEAVGKLEALLMKASNGG
jgi:integrase